MNVRLMVVDLIVRNAKTVKDVERSVKRRYVRIVMKPIVLIVMHVSNVQNVNTVVFWKNVKYVKTPIVKIVINVRNVRTVLVNVRLLLLLYVIHVSRMIV